MFETWVFLALIAVFMYGTSQTIVKVAFKDISVATMILINFITTMPIYATFLVASSLRLEISQLGFQVLLIGLMAALLGRAGYYAYLEALESGPVTIVGSITAAYPAIITILALTVLHESITLAQGIGIILVIGGIVALSYANNGQEGERKLSRKGIFYCAVTLAVWGLWGLFAKMALLVLPIATYLGLYAIALPFVFSGYMLGKKIRISKVFPRWSLPVIIAVISVMIGQLGLFADTAAVSIGNASIVFPLIASYPVVTVIEAQIFLNERLTIKDFALIALVISGIVLVSTV